MFLLQPGELETTEATILIDILKLISLTLFAYFYRKIQDNWGESLE